MISSATSPATRIEIKLLQILAQLKQLRPCQYLVTIERGNPHVSR
jgi:hypothetical protein